MKKLMALVLTLALVFTLCACGQSTAATETETETAEEETAAQDAEVVEEESADNTAEEEEADAQIANPWTEAESVEAAEETLGYGIEVPETVAEAEQTAVRVMNSEDGSTMLEIVYGENETVIRKAPGADDISGDYNTYDSTEEVTVGELTVTEKGDGENVFSAIWTNGDYAYSFYSTVGISADALAELVAAIQ